MTAMDEDAAIAAVDLVRRCGAKELSYGYLHDDVPVEEAGWYAHAQYRGARITVENHKGPVEALEALARRLLEGAMCTHCGGLVAISDEGAMFYPHAFSPLPGYAPLTEAQARSRPQCRYRRMGNRWVRGCAREDGATPTEAARRERLARRARPRNRR